MCGICGIVSLTGESVSEKARATTLAMVDALAHRGPDDRGTICSGSAAMGSTRLAIRGIEDGRQPLVDSRSQVVVVCNGEIDNHQELREWLAARGRPVEHSTDVAVIPGLFLELGDSFVERLTGVFAIALWDPLKRRLILARDRAGERLLFFTIDGDVVHFATELSALAMDSALSLTPCKTALVGYLQNGTFSSPSSPFTQVQKVSPAEVVTIDAGGVHRRRYWRWNIRGAPKRPPSLDAFDEVFREAVRRQSDVDVECGLFISGGLDSSLVSAVMKSVRAGRRLRAYTIRFGEPSYDEGRFAERIAQILGIELTSVLVRPEVFPAEIARLVRLVGEPLGDQAWVPTALLARRASQDVKLALVGEGADELFGGYPTYLGATLGAYYGRLPASFQRAFKWVVDRWSFSDRKVTLSFLLKRFVQGWNTDGVSRHLLWTASVSPALLQRLGLAHRPPDVGDRSGRSLLDAVQELDFETTLAEGLLMKKDRGSMSSAVELRSPFLDRAVMEFAASLPTSERVRGLTTKVFLKRYALRYLPRWVVYRKKRGLSVPFSSWMRGPLYEWARFRLDSELFEGIGLNRRAAVELLDEHRKRAADHGRALWTLIVLSEWLEWAATSAVMGLHGH